MGQIQTYQFKMETNWQELANKRIQRIDCDLREIRFVNQGKLLLAKGSIRRMIIYIEYDGRFKKAEDGLQFEAILGEATARPLSNLKAELRQDYYLFQPRPIGGGQAVLEQGFSLCVTEAVSERSQSASRLLVDLIIEKNYSSTVRRLPAPLPDWRDRPRGFRGTVHFEALPDGLTTAIVNGAIEYFSFENNLREMDFQNNFSFIIKVNPDGPDCFLAVKGEIADFAWARSVKDDGWELEIKIDYRWYLLKKKELNCVTDSGPLRRGKPPKRIKTASLGFNKEIVFSKRIDCPFFGGEPAEIKAELFDKRESFTKKGLLLEAKLRVEAFYLDGRGREAYQSWTTEFLELVQEVETALAPDAALVCAAAAKTVGWENATDQLRINLAVGYQIKIYHPIVVEMTEEAENNCLILARTENESKSFSAWREQKIQLKRKPFRIERLDTRIIKERVLAREGWIRIEEELTVTVSYVGFTRRVYEETFPVVLAESFSWPGITPTVWLETATRVEYDSYTVEAAELNYQFLLNFEISSYSEAEFPVQPAVAKFPGTATEVDEKLKDQSFEKPIRLSLEEELPLTLSSPREIAEGKSYLTKFNYREAFKAVLVEGEIRADLEYWDGKGFLRKESLSFSFWRFIRVDLGNSARLIPEILSGAYRPLKAWPWRRGEVKARIELELRKG